MPLFPEQASTIAGEVDRLFLALLTVAGVLATTVAVLIVYFVVKYRRRANDEVPTQMTGSNRLEIAWTVVPLVLALGAFTWAGRLYFDVIRPPAGALDIYVVGQEWMWKFEHIDGQQEIDELHVPTSQPIRLMLVSQDVIHSFYVPAFRVKQDALPDRYTTLWFQVTKPGRYHMFCAEYCGTDHARMTGWVIALSPADYQAWLSGGAGANESPASAGARLFQQFGCASCHRSDSLQRAPVLDGVFGQPVQLESGDLVSADENYLRESILEPSARVVAGYESIMPSFRGQVSEAQLIELITYIKSLSGPASGATPASPNTTPEPTIVRQAIIPFCPIAIARVPVPVSTPVLFSYSIPMRPDP